MDINNLTSPITVKTFMKENYRNISSNSIDILFNMRGVTKITLNSSQYSLGLYDVIVVNPYEPYEIY